MKDEVLLKILEETVEKLSIRLEYDDLRKGEVNTPGGMYTLHDRKHILLHKGLSVSEKVDVLLRILSGLDTEGVHLPPEVRKRLDSSRGSP